MFGFLLVTVQVNPLTPMRDQDRISPYNINTMSIRQVLRTQKNVCLKIFQLIQYQILRISITGLVWQTVRRIIDEILDMKGLEHRSQVIALVRHDIVCLDDKTFKPFQEN